MKTNDARADNLFSRLFSYSPRGSREPLEDYCTEAVAWCLRASPSFREKFLEFAGIGSARGKVAVEVIETQVPFRPQAGDGENEDGESLQRDKGGRFDLLIRGSAGSKFAVVFEAKVSSRFGNGQLAKYRREMENSESFANIPADRRLLATLTNSPDKERLASIHMRWYEVEQMLRETAEAQTGNDGEFEGKVCKQFAEFLGDHGMKAIKIPTITSKQLGDKIAGLEFGEALKELLTAVRKRSEDLQKLFNNRVVFDENKNGTWLGVYNRSGLPDFYFGFRLRDEEKHTDYSCIIEAVTELSRKELIKKADPKFKLNSEPKENGLEFFCIRQAVIPDLDGKGEQIVDWFVKAIAEARRLASLRK